MIIIDTSLHFSKHGTFKFYAYLIFFLNLKIRFEKFTKHYRPLSILKMEIIIDRIYLNFFL